MTREQETRKQAPTLPIRGPFGAGQGFDEPNEYGDYPSAMLDADDRIVYYPSDAEPYVLADSDV